MSGGVVPHWHGYYDADEISEIYRALSSTTVRSNDNNLRVRVYEQDGDAPTVMVAHGLLGYGLTFARFHLPFWRRGWRVVQFDFPGMGESGGKRGAATVDEMMTAWRDVHEWTVSRYGGPLFAIGNAEDGVIAYYTLANDPTITALSVHTFFEYGDAHAVGWVPPWAAGALRKSFRSLERISSDFSLPGQWTIPWKHVFAGTDDAAYRRHLASDPACLRRGKITLGRALLTPRKPAVAFEDCKTPVQVIISRQSRIWPAGPVRRSAERLGGPREIIELNAPHWDMSRAFHDDYCAHVMEWFERRLEPAPPVSPQRTRVGG